jgi:hypothetical protein
MLATTLLGPSSRRCSHLPSRSTIVGPSVSFRSDLSSPGLSPAPGRLRRAAWTKDTAPFDSVTTCRTSDGHANSLGSNGREPPKPANNTSICSIEIILLQSTGQLKNKVTHSHVYNEVTSEPTITRYITFVRKTLELCNWRGKVFRAAVARGDRVAKWRFHRKRRSRYKNKLWEFS